MAKQPIELMFNGYRRKLLSVLLLQDDERYHVRELARLTYCYKMMSVITFASWLG
jgi:hypothetical protein